MIPLTATGPEVYVVTTTAFFSDSHDDLYETIVHIKSLKIKSYPGENITYLYTVVLVDDDRLDSSGDFDHDHLGYIT